MRLHRTSVARHGLTLALLIVSIACPSLAVAQSPLPFDPPPPNVLRSSPKKVFAHYFVPFPISLDNKPPAQDYYAVNYLRPDGENDKFQAGGGFLRERPLPRAPISGPDWFKQDMETEVRRAAALGIDGFSVDLLSPPDTKSVYWNWVVTLIEAAESVDPGFRILLMPDFHEAFGKHPEALTETVLALNKYPNLYRLADGRLVIAPFYGEGKPPDWWAAWMASMKNQGVATAFVPVFLGWQQYASAYAPVSYGFSDWGVKSPGLNKSRVDEPKQVRRYVPVSMLTVSPQDMRPKDLLYWEAVNSENYREMWRNAISGHADWVQIVTWNDYSESTEIAPSTGIQWSFYDLTAYYTAWFKTGIPPKITRDVLYYFHRIEPVTTGYDPAVQPHPFAQFADSNPPSDQIELLAFLTKPGLLTITIAGHVYRHRAGPGITSFKVPLATGTPAFGLERGGKTVLSVTSLYPIVEKTPYQDLLYRGGSSSRAPAAFPR